MPRNTLIQMRRGTASQNGYIRFTAYSGANWLSWNAVRFPVTANVPARFVFPINAPVSTANMNPSANSGTINTSAITSFVIGVYGMTPDSAATFTLSEFKTDVPKSAYIELQTPDFLADTSLVSQKWNGSTYETNRVLKLDSTATVVSADTTKMVFNDGTKFDDVYGTGNGRSNFPKGGALETKSGTLAGSSMTYSANSGTAKRVGFRVDLPPSDSGRTLFSSVRFKIILYYSDINKATNILPDLSGNSNNGTMDRVGLVPDNTGKTYGAMKFDGVSSNVSLGATNLNLSTSLTFVAWIYLTNVHNNTSSRIDIFCRDNTDSTDNITVAFRGSQAGGKLNIRVKYGAGATDRYEVYGNITSWPAQTWYRIVGIIDTTTSTGKIYRNGVDITESSSVSTTAIYTTNKRNSYLGSFSGISNFFNGLIADVKIYSRALSSDEIIADYNNQSVSSTGLVAQWQPATVANMGSTSYEFSDSTSASHGLQNLIKPWIALYDPSTTEIDFFLFTHRPKALISKRDETGNIHELILYPGNGSIYHGRVTHCNPSLDSDSDLAPDCIGNYAGNLIDSDGAIFLTSDSANFNVLMTSFDTGSLSGFLKSYGMVI